MRIEYEYTCSEFEVLDLMKEDSRGWDVHVLEKKVRGGI